MALELFTPASHCKQWHGHLCTGVSFPRYTLEGGLLCRMLPLCLMFSGDIELLSEWLTGFHSHQHVWGPHSLTSTCSSLTVYCIDCCPRTMRSSQWGFLWSLLMAANVGHLFICSLAIRYPPLEKYSAQNSFVFKTALPHNDWVMHVFLYILDACPLCFENILPYFATCVLTF